MTDKQCLGQIKKMMGTWNKGGLHSLLKESERLITSGAIDIAEEKKDDFYYAKIVLHVALETLSSQFAPISRTGEEIADNLRNF